MQKQLLPIGGVVFLLVGIGLIIYARGDSNNEPVPPPVVQVEPVKPKPKPRPNIFKPRPRPNPDKPNPDKPKPGVEPAKPPEPPKPQCNDSACQCNAPESKPKQYTPVPWETVPGLPDPNDSVDNKKAETPDVTVPAPPAQPNTYQTNTRRRLRRF